MSLKTISIWARKGGTGKSTLSFHLAGAAQKRGYKVLLVDADNQGSVVALKDELKEGFVIHRGYPSSLPDGIDLIIVDLPPRTDETPVGDTVIVPYQASRFAYTATEPYLEDLQAEGRNVVEVVSCVDGRIKRHVEMRDYKTTTGALYTTKLSVYEESVNEGVTVFNSKHKCTRSVVRARNEINAILDAAIA